MRERNKQHSDGGIALPLAEMVLASRERPRRLGSYCASSTYCAPHPRVPRPSRQAVRSTPKTWNGMKWPLSTSIGRECLIETSFLIACGAPAEKRWSI